MWDRLIDDQNRYVDQIRCPDYPDQNHSGCRLGLNHLGDCSDLSRCVCRDLNRRLGFRYQNFSARSVCWTEANLMAVSWALAHLAEDCSAAHLAWTAARSEDPAASQAWAALGRARKLRLPTRKTQR